VLGALDVLGGADELDELNEADELEALGGIEDDDVSLVETDAELLELAELVLDDAAELEGALLDEAALAELDGGLLDVGALEVLVLDDWVDAWLAILDVERIELIMPEAGLPSTQ
jgi:hypothetical protein